MIEAITVIRKTLGCLFEVKFLLLPRIGFSSARNFFHSFTVFAENQVFLRHSVIFIFTLG